MADVVLEEARSKRKADSSLRESAKRTRTESSNIDPALLSSDTEEDNENYSDQHSEPEVSDAYISEGNVTPKPQSKVVLQPRSRASPVKEKDVKILNGQDTLVGADGTDSEHESDSVRRNTTTETPLTAHSPMSHGPNGGKDRAKFPSELKTIQCTWEGCGKTFNRPARLQAHLRSHTNERPSVCPYDGCEKAYLEDKHLKQHIKGTHTHERNHQCYVEGCGKSFLTATRLRRHQAAHEGHERFRCTEYLPCNQTFRKHQTLQRHIRADHLKLTPFPCQHVDQATGQQCSAGYDSAGALRKHEDRVHGALRFWCDECAVEGGQPSGFVTKAQLTKHMKTDHADCMFCDLKCSSEKELVRHIETFHSSGNKKESTPKSHACEYEGCRKTFTKKFNLTVHVRSAHEGQRFTCGTTRLEKYWLDGWDGHDACGRDFVSKVNLEDHIRTQHLGLPSIINAKKIRNQKNTTAAKQRAQEAMPRLGVHTAHIKRNPVGAITGMGYEQDRDVTCLISGCPSRFMRLYDRQLHLRAKHGFMPTVADPSLERDMTALEKNPDLPPARFHFNEEGGLYELYEGMKDYDARQTFDMVQGMGEIRPSSTLPELNSNYFNFNFDEFGNAEREHAGDFTLSGGQQAEQS